MPGYRRLGLAPSSCFTSRTFPSTRERSFLARQSRLLPLRTEIAGGEWLIKLDGRDEIRDLQTAIRRTGGYVVSHVGELVRADGNSFDADQARDALGGFGELLSFASGARCYPFLLVGYDVRGVARWRTWRPPTVTQWAGRFGWFTPSDPTCFHRAYGGLVSEASRDGVDRRHRSPLP